MQEIFDIERTNEEGSRLQRYCSAMIAEGKQKYLNAPKEHFGTALKYFFEKIKKEFEAQQISIPYPQMELHVNKGEGGGRNQIL